MIQNTLFRYSPRTFHSFRVFLLRLFRADIPSLAFIYPSVKVWLPRNLSMGHGSCLGDNVSVYNIAKVTIGRNSTVSQESILCTAGHDYRSPGFDLFSAEIVIGDDVWLTMRCFVSPGCTILDGSVLLPCSCLTKSTVTNGVYGGVPASLVKYRYE